MNGPSRNRLPLARSFALRIHVAGSEEWGRERLRLGTGEEAGQRRRQLLGDAIELLRPLRAYATRWTTSRSFRELASGFIERSLARPWPSGGLARLRTAHRRAEVAPPGRQFAANEGVYDVWGTHGSALGVADGRYVQAGPRRRSGTARRWSVGRAQGRGLGTWTSFTRSHAEARWAVAPSRG
jgi:hypothetical protein